MQMLLGCPLTYAEAVAVAVPAVVQAAVGLEEEKATGSVEVVGSDAAHVQTFSLPQQLLFPGQRATVRSGLGSEVTGGHAVQSWKKLQRKCGITRSAKDKAKGDVSRD